MEKKECFCCKKIKEVTHISSSSNDKGKTRLICKDCNHV